MVKAAVGNFHDNSADLYSVLSGTACVVSSIRSRAISYYPALAVWPSSAMWCLGSFGPPWPDGGIILCISVSVCAGLLPPGHRVGA